jgi:poly(ADP-ribose) glycohydrolase
MTEEDKKVKLPCYEEKYLSKWSKIQYYFKNEIKNLIELSEILTDIQEKSIFKLKKGYLYKYLKENESENKTFFKKTLPFLQKSILKMKTLFPKDNLPELLINNEKIEEQILTLTKEQIICLMSSAFFGFLPDQKYLNHQFQYSLTFVMIIFEGEAGKFECLMNYFKRVSSEEPKGKISFHRKSVNKVDFEKSDKKLSKMIINNEKIIEDFDLHLKVDFANMFIGGGVLAGGLLQEEIMFVIIPECLISLLFCSRMSENESILIRGAERYSLHKGKSN